MSFLCVGDMCNPPLTSIMSGSTAPLWILCFFLIFFQADAFTALFHASKFSLPTRLSEASADLSEKQAESQKIHTIPTTSLYRAQVAKGTWSTVALQTTSNIQRKEIVLNGESSTIYNRSLFDEFTSIKGTYFMNGLASCQIGNRLIHPFEAHGHCKSLVFDGKGKMYFTSNVIETPVTKKERMQDRVLNRGVMSTVANTDSIMGIIQNALSSSERDTANLTANLWPRPFTKNKDKIEPLLITCTDNGEPYALDPSTLETRGRLIDVVPKLASIFPEGSKCLAHTRYDEKNNLFVMCVYKMIIPGERFLGNSHLEFIEFNDNFDVVSRRAHTSRFMVVHDWALTENYYVVPKNPAYLKWGNIVKFSLGQSLGSDVFAMEEDTNGEFIFIPRHDANDSVNEVKSDAFFNCFHFGPVYENRNENEIVINGCVFDSYTFGGEMGFDESKQEFFPIEWGSTGLENGAKSPPPRLDQFIIDAKTFTMKRKVRVPLIPVDMPVFLKDTLPCKYSYFLGASRAEGWFPFKQIVQLNLDTFEYIVYDAGENQVVSEPVFIPKKNPKSEDDGFLLSYVHDAKMKDAKIVILDSKTFVNGPIAECVIDKLFPWCIHGNFYSDYTPFLTNQ